MPSLAEIAFGPNVTGAIGQGAQVRQSLNTVREQNRRNRGLQALDTLVSQPLPTDRAGQAAAAQNVGATGGFEAFSQARQLFGEMGAEQAERELAEGRQIATGLAGVTDQATYETAVRGLQERGIDVSRLPAQFDPNLRDFLVNLPREVEDVAPLTPEQFRQQMGLRQAGAGSATTNINVGSEVGTIPPGFELITDAAGNRVMRPIAGGPVAREAEAEAAAAESRAETRQQTFETVSTSAENIRRIMSEADLPTTGFAGGILANIGGTSARDVAAEIETIKANASFARLQQMREESPTGGALGQVSNVEIGLLANNIGSLEQSQSQEAFLRNLDRVIESFRVLTSGTPEERDQLLAAEAGGAIDTGRFAGMSVEQLRGVDLESLTAAERDQLAARLTELGL